MGLHDITVYHIVRRNARINASGTALVFEGNAITNLDFLNVVDRLAAGLAAAGIGHGMRIGILSKNCPEYVYLYGAAAKIGAVVLPINWRLTSDEIGYILSDASPEVFFVEPEFEPLIGAPGSSSGNPELCFSVGEGEGGLKSFSELLKDPAGVEEVEVSSGDGIVMIYTAAVAGRPRGAVLTHQGLCSTSLELASQWGLQRDDANLGVLPLFHVAGLLALLAAVQAGGKNVLLPGFDPGAVLKCIEDHRVSFFISFPPMLSSLLDKADAESGDLSSMRHVVGIDQPETIYRFEKAAGATFWASYGQTETSGITSLAPYEDRPGSAGQPIRPARVQVHDEYGNRLPPGKSGEIVVRGPTVFQGYWNLPDETAHTFRGNWHHTGDQGHFDEDGFLWFEGRVQEKELIKPGGENVYPAEVEKVILEHPLVEEVSVIGVPDEQWGEAIKAICVLKQGETLAESEVIQFVASRIARYKKPKHVVFASGLPKRQDGSVDRAEVKAKYG